MRMQKERTPRIHGWMTLHMGAHQGYNAGLGSFRQVSNNQISNCIYEITLYCIMSVDMILLFSPLS